jgi:purine-nucleoside phosphorylase
MILKSEDTAYAKQLELAVEFLKHTFGTAPTTALVLGSGLSGFLSQLSTGSHSVSTSDVPGANSSSVLGHAGKLAVGKLQDSKLGTKSVAILAGRIHGYEGHSPQQVVHILRALRKWGVKRFILTNATGSTQRTYRPGNLVLISDHINFTGLTPLRGAELFGGTRFPDMTDAYSKEWRKKARSIAKKLRIPIKEGVYIGVNGPSFETAAEIKMFAKWGAHICGMSTVWETIALRQMGAEVLGLSCVTNFGTGVSNKVLSHEEVLVATEKIQNSFAKLMKAIILSGSSK